jgi:hypothetical protein
MLFRQTLHDYCNGHAKYINIQKGKSISLDAKALDTHSKHCNLKGLKITQYKEHFCKYCNMNIDLSKIL